MILAAMATVLLFATLGQTVVSTAFPVIIADLGGMAHVKEGTGCGWMVADLHRPSTRKLSNPENNRITCSTTPFCCGQCGVMNSCFRQ
jgi:hypothetical protein